MIFLVDFGSQTSHLIKRRLVELGQSVRIVLPQTTLAGLKAHKPKGIILSGGPASVYAKNGLTINPAIFDQKIPVLGICYGLQLMVHLLGGVVRSGRTKEFGPAVIRVGKHSPLFVLSNLSSFPSGFTVWMSHGDEVVKLPPGFTVIASTPTVRNAAIAWEKKKLYGVQFHPEVTHTQYGMELLVNFLSICGLSIKKQPLNHSFVDRLATDIQDSLGTGKAIGALSGGVDSSVAALLTARAIGPRFKAVYIDSGLMRQGETVALRKIFKQHYRMKVQVIDAAEIFLKKLKNIIDPEEKRRIIGQTFIAVLEKAAQEFGATFLVQGTIYSDLIESAGTHHSVKIKTHHNVAGLPKKMKLTLVEPLRNLYKDEVRKIGQLLRLPPAIGQRQPFPGPGLAIRIIGEVTERKLKTLRAADAIVQQEISRAGLSDKLWQVFAVYTGIKTTGVAGDGRAYGETMALRAIEAKDAMSARWARLPYQLLETISTRIVNEIPEVNRVVYDITNKPPGTMEWE